MLLALHANVDLKDQLVSFRIANGGLTAKDKPTRMKLLNWGVNETIKGPVTIGPETVKHLSANQAKLGYDRVALDFNHQTVPGSDEYEQIVKQRGSIDPLPVAAYGTPVVVPNDGLYLENIVWTPEGEKQAANYHDLSPTPKLDANGEVVFLHSVALCRQGAVKDLTFYNATFLKPMSTPAAKDTPANATDYKGLIATLLKKLGVQLSDAPSDSDIATAVDQFKAPAAAAGGADPAAGTPMSAENKAILARVEKLEGAGAESERTGLIALAAQHGKAIPLSADVLKTIPIPALREMVDKLPATVPLNARQGGNPNREADKGKITTLTAEQKQICKNLQIPEEKYLVQLNSEKEAGLTIL